VCALRSGYDVGYKLLGLHELRSRELRAERGFDFVHKLPGWILPIIEWQDHMYFLPGWENRKSDHRDRL